MCDPLLAVVFAQQLSVGVRWEYAHSPWYAPAGINEAPWVYERQGVTAALGAQRRGFECCYFVTSAQSSKVSNAGRTLRYHRQRRRHRKASPKRAASFHLSDGNLPSPVRPSAPRPQVYYLMYSGAGANTEAYRIGYATASAPLDGCMDRA